jgi:hypothetical protein
LFRLVRDYQYIQKSLVLPSNQNKSLSGSFVPAAPDKMEPKQKKAIEIIVERLSYNFLLDSEIKPLFSC